MDRRQVIKGGVLVVGGGLVAGFGPPACDGVSKDKAVRYTGLVIDLVKDTAPLFQLLDAPEIAQLVIDKAVPALEKLKDALAKADIPTAGSFFDTTTSILGQISNALFQLSESARRDTIIGIIATVNLMLRTVKLFVDSEAPTVTAVDLRRAAGGYKPSVDAIAVRKAFEASRF